MNKTIIFLMWIIYALNTYKFFNEHDRNGNSINVVFWAIMMVFSGIASLKGLMVLMG